MYQHTHTLSLTLTRTHNHNHNHSQDDIWLIYASVNFDFKEREKSFYLIHSLFTDFPFSNSVVLSCCCFFFSILQILILICFYFYDLFDVLFFMFVRYDLFVCLLLTLNVQCYNKFYTKISRFRQKKVTKRFR